MEREGRNKEMERRKRKGVGEEETNERRAFKEGGNKRRRRKRKRDDKGGKATSFCCARLACLAFSGPRARPKGKEKQPSETPTTNSKQRRGRERKEGRKEGGRKEGEANKRQKRAKCSARRKKMRMRRNPPTTAQDGRFIGPRAEQASKEAEKAGRKADTEPQRKKKKSQRRWAPEQKQTSASFAASHGRLETRRGTYDLLVVGPPTATSARWLARPWAEADLAFGALFLFFCRQNPQPSPLPPADATHTGNRVRLGAGGERGAGQQCGAGGKS